MPFHVYLYPNEEYRAIIDKKNLTSINTILVIFLNKKVKPQIIQKKSFRLKLAEILTLCNCSIALKLTMLRKHYALN